MVLYESSPVVLYSAETGNQHRINCETEKCGKGKEAAYYIKVTVPEDFEFSKVPIELKLADGAVLSEESNCLVTDLAGRIIISLQVEHPILTVENGDQKRDYQFLISVDS